MPDEARSLSTESALPGTGSSLPEREDALPDHEDALPDEGRLPSFTRATSWIGSEPLAAESLRGRVVLVDFWTYTCVNWLRTLPYLRAWDARYRDAGLTIVGVHTPEFGFEHELQTVAARRRALGVEYPVAVDSDYGVWDDFANRYWPALYLADADGRMRFHWFGEGEYDTIERAIQQLLAGTGSRPVDPGLVAVEQRGLEVAADWASLRSPETYLGYGQSSGFVSEDRRLYDSAHVYPGSGRLERNSWDLSGDWTVARHASVLNRPGGRIAFGFHARDVNLVMGPGAAGSPIRFRVFLDGHGVDGAQGSDVDSAGRGTVATPDTYQLIRQHERITDRTFEIEFLDGGAEAYCFTFG